jgi:hypothetical protein
VVLGRIPGTTTTTRKPSPPPSRFSPGRLSRLRPQRPHLLRPPALRLRPARRRPRLPGQSPRPHGSADRSRPAVHLSGTKLRQRLQGRGCWNFFPNDPARKSLSKQVWLLADWLAAKAPEWVAGRLQGAQVLLHGHCHHKAVFGGPASEIALLRQAGATVEPIQAGCCGMAGPFGFEADKFEVSKAIANRRPAAGRQSAGPMTLIVADGFSCREQIAQLIPPRDNFPCPKEFRRRLNIPWWTKSPEANLYPRRLRSEGLPSRRGPGRQH